jgi:anti-sigma factor RsiW
MKDSKFRELVHIYIDGDISPRDFMVLQRYLAQSEEYRRYFVQHCRLQRALSLALGKSRRVPDGEKICERIRRRRARQQRIPALMGGAVVLMMALFMALPVVMVDKEIEGKLDHHIRQIQNVVNTVPFAFSSTSAPAVDGVTEMVNGGDIYGTTNANMLANSATNEDVIAEYDDGNYATNTMTSSVSDWASRWISDIPGHSSWTREARVKALRSDLF